ncbi:hypothetical protein WICMUC_004349 [Wickerhamomyces mucosus]|uniref:GPI-anchored wall transfer protein n=1 Tax=Wickerhamomyces mucosus TaxID=1378264 RepID=A0A9P8PJ48_9ASCO|nr:hypothetical protein WICMUC_004349 [Wickerhamomyces mucosus]
MSSLKERKEAFVSNLSGGEIWEINVVTSIALVGYFSSVVLSRYTLLFKKKEKWGLSSLLLDFLLNWIGLLLSITIYADYPLYLACGILIPTALLTVLYYSPSRSFNKTKQEKQLTERSYLPKKPFITAYRGGMLIITALAILGVDFKIFPRRFAKVETWGTSLMDLGVGSFVFSLGIVSARSVLLENFRAKSDSYFRKLKKSLSGTTTSLILASLRLIFVKNLDYQEHVSEYGVHWNFFLTLVLVGPLAISIEPLFKIAPRCTISIIISLTYEWFICKKEGFLNFLLLAPRTNLISANREGIFSLIGYFSIYLAGQSTGFYLLPSKPSKNNLFTPGAKNSIVSSEKWKPSIIQNLTTVTPIQGLITWFIVYFSLFNFVLANHDYNVSRRLANLPYVLWVCSYNTGFLVFYSIIDELINSSDASYDEKISISLESINSNGMILFLLSNISTGIVNLSINTLDASPGVSIAVLITYSSVIAIAGGILYHYKIFIKL